MTNTNTRYIQVPSVYTHQPPNSGYCDTCQKRKIESKSLPLFCCHEQQVSLLWTTTPLQNADKEVFFSLLSYLNTAANTLILLSSFIVLEAGRCTINTIIKTSYLTYIVVGKSTTRKNTNPRMVVQRIFDAITSVVIVQAESVRCCQGNFQDGCFCCHQQSSKCRCCEPSGYKTSSSSIPLMERPSVSLWPSLYTITTKCTALLSVIFWCKHYYSKVSPSPTTYHGSHKLRIMSRSKIGNPTLEKRKMIKMTQWLWEIDFSKRLVQQSFSGRTPAVGSSVAFSQYCSIHYPCPSPIPFAATELFRRLWTLLPILVTRNEIHSPRDFFVSLQTVGWTVCGQVEFVHSVEYQLDRVPGNPSPMRLVLLSWHPDGRPL